MSSILAGVNIAVLGGDDREIVLVTELLRMGANVRVAGISKLAQNKDVQCFYKVEEAVKGARFVILPMSGINEQGIITAKYAVQPIALDSETLSKFSDDCVVLTGVARPLLKELVEQRRIRVIEVTQKDAFAILNSIPSAEGAIKMAMDATDITIHGSNSIVIGFGRCGKTLARTLAALGAHTSVVARKNSDLARITEMGLKPLTYLQLQQYIGDADIIFNTVPSLVLDKSLLEKVKPDVYICDIASAPGGVNYAVAQELGINAQFAPSLPGKVAPKTAGLILAQVIPEIITTELTNTSSVCLDEDRR